MPCIHIPIEPIGPVIELGISAPISQQAAGAPPSAIHWVRAVVDTGCTHTAIHSAVAQRAGLSKVGIATVNTTGGTIPNSIYHGDLILRPLVHGKPFEFRFSDCQIGEMVHPNPLFEALMGMNVINVGMFVTNGSNKSATFCW